MTMFFQPVNLSNNTAGKSASRVRSAAVNDHVFVAWAEGAANKSHILLRATHDGGANFRPSRPISDNTLYADRPEIAVVGQFVHVLYVEYRNPQVLLLRTSRDYGEHFADPVQVGNPGDLQYSVHPNTRVAAAGHNVYVVWCGTTFHTDPDKTVFFRRSTNHGGAFAPTIPIGGLQLGGVQDPQIAVYGDDVYVIWVQGDMYDGPSDVFFVGSHDGGKTFTLPVNLSNNNNNGWSRNAQIAVSGSNVYVTWTTLPFWGDTKNRRDIIFRVSQDRGITFQKPVNLSQNTEDYMSDDPEIAAIENYVFVVWETGPSGGDGSTGQPSGDVFYTQNNNHGELADFSSPLVNISDLTGQNVSARFPQVAVQGDRISVVWTRGAAWIAELYYSSSVVLPMGASFESPIRLGIIDPSRDANLPREAPRPYVTWGAWPWAPNQPSDAIFITGT